MSALKARNAMTSHICVRILGIHLAVVFGSNMVMHECMQ